MQYEGKDGPDSPTGGVKAIAIEGRFGNQRERLAGGFTDADRTWRAQFLKDQVLHHEPVTPEWYYKERYNPIRRLYRWPLETLFQTQNPNTKFMTHAYRFWTGKICLAIAGGYVGYYIFKYHSNDWQNVSGWESIRSKPYYTIGSEGYGKVVKMKPADYYDNIQGVGKSPI
ncbi:uncharacterized protein LOC117643199 isoform X2 [Thrips palmi]|nr:uncharacterized protein LOC117643199 isoform X2 [Thrips palmi]XP_034237843.1 uncharacterized protein LOC117643199 isoform X2 [Thrips palmi]XP_034237844.1 uncharacterized protein LOC117643199 isoform X2 [Thrips palmi]